MSKFLQLSIIYKFFSFARKYFNHIIASILYSIFFFEYKKSHGNNFSNNTLLNNLFKSNIYAHPEKIYTIYICIKSYIYLYKYIQSVSRIWRWWKWKKVIQEKLNSKTKSIFLLTVVSFVNAIMHRKSAIVLR